MKHVLINEHLVKYFCFYLHFQPKYQFSIVLHIHLENNKLFQIDCLDINDNHHNPSKIHGMSLTAQQVVYQCHL